MLTSIFRKILTVYLSVIIVAFSVLTIVLNFEIKHFLEIQRLKVLSKEAKAVLPILERVNGNPRSYPEYRKVVSRFKSRDDVSVNVLLVRDSRLKKIKRMTDQIINHNEILNTSALQAVLAGQEIQLIGPFRRAIHGSMLVVGVPIKNNNEVIGALFLHTPVQELQMGQVI